MFVLHQSVWSRMSFFTFFDKQGNRDEHCIAPHKRAKLFNSHIRLEQTEGSSELYGLLRIVKSVSGAAPCMFLVCIFDEVNIALVRD